MNTAKIMLRKMNLSELVENYLKLPENLDVELTGIELDSRLLEKGDLFIAYKGEHFDGRDYIDAAIEKGAQAVLIEAKDDGLDVLVKSGVPIISINKLNHCIGKIAARFFADPASDLWLIGITGTNGKTSCCEFISKSLSQLGHKCGSSGTLGCGIYDNLELSRCNVADVPAEISSSVPQTTPDAITVQKIFEEVRIRQADIMTMEVSSHGLHQNRVNVAEFDVAVFTNLSREHLDFHGGMKPYGDAKRKLFNSPKLKIAVVNLDDMFSASILNSLSKSVRSYTYSLKNPQANVYAKELKFTQAGFYIELVSPWGEGTLNSSLLGAFNASNLLAAVTTVMATEARKDDFDFSQTLQTIAAVRSVVGRMEIIGDFPLSVVVDYAHTPDGLKNALEALKQHFDGKVWCVFGCGGDRDKGKRPLMAEVAELLADELIVTDDNPRQESSVAIIEQILTGFTSKNVALVENDRAKAIDFAITNANPGDVVLIAGKGHEEYQDVAGSRMAFSDVKQARLCLNKRFMSVK